MFFSKCHSGPSIATVSTLAHNHLRFLFLNFKLFSNRENVIQIFLRKTEPNNWGYPTHKKVCFIYSIIQKLHCYHFNDCGNAIYEPAAIESSLLNVQWRLTQIEIGITQTYTKNDLFNTIVTVARDRLGRRSSTRRKIRRSVASLTSRHTGCTAHNLCRLNTVPFNLISLPVSTF